MLGRFVFELSERERAAALCFAQAEPRLLWICKARLSVESRNTYLFALVLAYAGIGPGKGTLPERRGWSRCHCGCVGSSEVSVRSAITGFSEESFIARSADGC